MVHDYLINALEGIVAQEAWGETAYFYNPGNVLKRGTYFATVKQKDGDNDKASALDRDGIWRLSLGVEKSKFTAMFGTQPPRPAKGCSIEGPWVHTQLNTIMPHPVYGWMSWIAVLNPDDQTFEHSKLLIESAHNRAKTTFDKRVRSKG